jgi:hypothetical protein
MRSIAFLLLCLLSVSPCHASGVDNANNHAKGNQDRGLGVTYDQAIYYLSDFAMAQAAPVDGREHWTGQSHNKLCVLDIIGPHADIYQATLTVAVSSNISDDDKATDAGATARFMLNLSPGWDGATSWMVSAIGDVMRGGNGTTRTTVQAGRKYQITNTGSSGLTISVQPA